MLFRSLFSRFSHSIFYLHQGIKIALGLERLSIDDKSTLQKHFPYYKNLKLKHKEEFESRLLFFITIKQFIPRREFNQVTREMKLLIGATAVMVSFGFRKVTLRHFRKILVYPDNYYSTINQQYHQGEVNPKLGIIVLSWRSFVSGLANHEDGINLGIHEMAHALKLENQIHYNQESNFFNPERWKKYSALAHLEIEKMRLGESSFFRSSASKNPHEFFAVALEAFFERSAELKEYNADLYRALVFLLKQDPLTLS